MNAAPGEDRASEFPAGTATAAATAAARVAAPEGTGASSTSAGGRP